MCDNPLTRDDLASHLRWAEAILWALSMLPADPAHPRTAEPEPDLRAALEDAGLDPDKVEYVWTATPERPDGLDVERRFGEECADRLDTATKALGEALALLDRGEVQRARVTLRARLLETTEP